MGSDHAPTKDICLTMPNIKAVIFDLGDTLIFFDGDWQEIFERAQKTLLTSLIDAGIEVQASRFLHVFNAALEAYYAQREIDLLEYTTIQILSEVLSDLGYTGVPYPTLENTLADMYAITQEYWTPEEDAMPTIQTLQARGYRLGIISNAANDRDVQTLVDKARIRPYMDFIISSAAYGVRKPDATIFQAALQHWNFAPQETAMVGDTLRADILGAKRLNIFSIWITRRATPPENRPAAATVHPDAIIKTLTELPEVLSQH